MAPNFKPIPTEVGQVMEGSSARAEHECAAVGGNHLLDDPIGQPLVIRLITRIRHLGINQHPHLPGMVERTSELQGLGGFTAQSSLDKREVIRPIGKGGTGQHDATLPGKEMLSKKRPHFNRSARKSDWSASTMSRRSADFQPVHHAGLSLFQQGFGGHPDLLRPLAEGTEFHLLGIPFHPVSQQLQGGNQLTERRTQRIVDDVWNRNPT